MRISKTGICNNGFTLLELIVVIFIVSLMLAFSFPHFDGMGDGKMKSEARNVASILRYMNDSALATKETCTIKVNFGQKTLSYKGGGEEKIENLMNLSGLHLQSRGTVSDGEVIIFFGPIGASESFTVYLKGEKSKTAITFNCLSGRVKVLSGEQLRSAEEMERG
ncbi:MAG: prepilin-type N-terminal cleavage/methylation domain-containing protein [Proteobacteria bacterium]|nr:prepilin-type N-terminal cleavage/methylation domain-containing protein [Desulfobacteraceae bacterium]MBU4012715.1 prepilin-type N-terminal cleavage/methylation domain-containing protein [Pseudomonadota bacterium]